MRIKRLTLSNYRQHADLDIEFDGTLIAVVGRNGSGKSNTLGALQFAFTGEQPGAARPDLLRWGQTEGWVTCEFEHLGKSGMIKRALHSTSAELKYDNEKWSGISTVADAVRDVLGFDKDLLRQAGFVRQAEVDAILFDDPAGREKAFQRLVGIGEASKIHRNLGTYLTSLQYPADITPQLTECEERLELAKAELNDYVTRLAVMMSQQDIDDEQAKLDSELNSVNDSVSKADILATRANELETANSNLDKAQSAFSGLTLPEDDNTDPKDEDAEIEECDKQLDALKRLMELHNNVKLAESRLKTAEDAVTELGTPPVCPDVLVAKQKQRDDASAVVPRLKGEMTLYSQLQAGLAAGSTGQMDECPLCGRGIDDPASLKTRVDGAVNSLATMVNDATDSLHTVDTELQRLNLQNDEYKRNLAQREAEVVVAGEALRVAKAATVEAGVPDVVDLQSVIDELTTKRDDAVQSRKLLREAIDARNQERVKYATASANVKSANDAVTSVNSAILDIVATLYDDDDYPKVYTPEMVRTLASGLRESTTVRLATITDRRKTLQTAIAERADLVGRHAVASTSVKTLETTLESLQQRVATDTKVRSVIDTLKRTRDWFHHSNGPRTMSTAVLTDLCEDVNKFLGCFTAPFIVEPAEEGLGFRYIRTDGSAMPKGGYADATTLSGGQKIQLAVAFRLATYCMFASQLGILSLDEPTAYLDDENVGRFGILLSRIKELATSLNIQVLLATHERAILPHVDTIVDLSAN